MRARLERHVGAAKLPRPVRERPMVRMTGLATRWFSAEHVLGKSEARHRRRQLVALCAAAVAVSVLVAPSAATASTRDRLSGVVRDGGGDPVGEGEVVAENVETHQYASAPVEADGSYYFELPAGEYRVSVEAGESSKAHGGVSFTITSETFSVTEATVEDFSLPRLTSATVRVVDADDQPVAGVSVSLGDVSREFAGATEEGLGIKYGEDDSGQSCITPDAGTCEFVLFEGNKFSQFQFKLERPHELGFDVTGGEGEDTGEPTEILEQLPFAASELDRLSGVVRDGGGDPVGEGEVVAENVETHQYASAPVEADGSYYFELPAGEYRVSVEAGESSKAHGGVSFTITSETFSVTEATVEDFSLPRLTSATVRVVDADDQPVAGVSVSLGDVSREFASATEEGLGIKYGEDDSGQSCITPDAGTCEFVLFEGNKFSQFQFKLERPHELGFDVTGGEGEDTGEPTEILEQLPFAASELDRLSGVVRDGGGDPVGEGEVVAENVETHQYASAPVEADGSYYFELPAGEYRVSVEAGESSKAHGGVSFTITSETFSVTEATVEDFSLPRLTSATVRVVDADDQPVAGVSVSLGDVSREFAGATEEGLGIKYGEDDSGQSCITPDAGTCEFVLFEGNKFSQFQFKLERPHELGFDVTGGEGEDTGEPTEILEQLPFATVGSAGSEKGTVEVGVPSGDVLEHVAAEPAPPGLPEGGIAVVGALSYTVSHLHPGASVNVTIELPPGSDPTNVYKYESGTYVDVTSLATISGDTLTMHLTDGGLGDADHEANGVIVDPLVPVRIPATSRPQSISFVSSAPTNPNVGSVYRVGATATSGLAVSFSIDPSSTNKNMHAERQHGGL